MLTLNTDEQIIAVIPEQAKGPGWSNDVVWIYIVSSGGMLRTECLQPKEQSKELLTLFSVGEVVCRELKAAVLKQIFEIGGTGRSYQGNNEHDDLRIWTT